MAGKSKKNKRQRTNDKYPRPTGSSNSYKGKQRAAPENEIEIDESSYGYDHNYDNDYEYDDDGFIANGYTISFSDDFIDPAPIDEQAPRGGPGSQVLPVAMALPEGHDGDPTDGHEYLYLVRREAAGHPGVIISEAFMRQHQQEQAALLLAQASRQPIAGPSHRPSEEWRTAFLSRFTNMRATFANADPPAGQSALPAAYTPVPAAADESSWRTYINGRKSKAGPSATGEVSSSSGSRRLSMRDPKPAMPSLLRQLEHNTIISLLNHWNTWLGERIEALDKPASASVNLSSTIFLPPAARKAAQAKKALAAAATSAILPTPPATPVAALATAAEEVPKPLIGPLDAQWLFALLSVLDAFLSTGEISTLRDLARTCLDIADITKEWELKHSMEREEWKECTAACWMVVSIVWEVWGQRDLWDG